MIIGNEEIAMMLILHFDKVPESAEVISQVKISGRPDATNNCFHGAKIVILGSGNQLAVINYQYQFSMNLSYEMKNETRYMKNGT
jgi:hypothetical protein